MTSTLTVNLTGTSGTAGLPSGSVAKSFTNTGVDLASFSAEIGTSYEQLAPPADVAFPAHLMIVNDSASGTVSVSIDNTDTYKYASLEPGASLAISACTSKPYLKATVASQISCRVCEV